MKFFYLTAFLLFFGIFSCSQNHLDKNAVFVSPRGNDAWSGRLPEPNKDHTDGPFRTLQKAQKAVREIKSRGKTTVYFRGGTYPIRRSLQLGKMDSGRKGGRIFWKAFPGERVIFSGGKAVTGFHPVTESWALAHIRTEVKEKTVELDLKAAGIDSIPAPQPRGTGVAAKIPLQMELFFNGKPMTLARYPNSGWLKIASVPQFGHLERPGNVRQKRFGIPAGRHYGRFKISDPRIRQWASDEHVWMHGYFTWDWADYYQPVAKIDPKNLLIYPAKPYHRYGYTRGQRFYFYNVLAELDSAGEYYIDSQRGKLYFYPPSNLSEGKAVLSVLGQPMFVLRNATDISIEGIKFEYSRSGIVDASGCSRICVAGCEFSNVGNPAVDLEGGTENRVVSCDFSDLAGEAVHLQSGNRKTLSPGKSVVTNSRFERFGRVYRTYAPAIYLYGVGDTISHNVLHDAPHTAVLFKGNEHILEFNEVYDIAKETGDVGAFYIGRNWTWRGNVVRYNFFHDLHGPGLYGVRAVYFDDFTSGNTIYGNIFYRAGKAAFIGGGRDNRVENNLFVACSPSVHIDARGTSWASNYFDPKSPQYVSTLFDSLLGVHYKQPPYSEKYPELLHYLNDQPQVPKHNIIAHNVSFGGRFLDLWDGIDLSLVTIKNNFIADSILLRWSKNTDQTTDFVNYSITDSTIRARMPGNVFAKGNPGVQGFETGKIHIDKNSKIWSVGFKPIPADKIGLFRDAYRKSLPGKN